MRRRSFVIALTAVAAGAAAGMLRARTVGGEASQKKRDTSTIGRAAPVTTDEIGDQVQTLPRGALPVFAKSTDVRQLYTFAVDHAEELHYIPCFCGCGRFGHTSNRHCYVKSFNRDGTVTFTSHAAT